jgi:predicted nucleic acid-binding protein
MPLRLYLDTSVLGAEFDEESPERVALTRSLFEWIERGGHVVCYSTVTAAEVARAPERIRQRVTDWLRRWEIDLLEESAETDELAGAYLAAGALPADSRVDARHLAIASVLGVDAVVSWNFRHMVNLFRQRRVHAVNLSHGRPLLAIVSPQELVADEE